MGRRPALSSQLQRNQNVQNKTSSNSLHLNIYTFYAVVYLHVYLLSPLKPQKNEKCVILVADFIQRLRIKCRCLTKKSFNIKENIMLTIFQYPCPSLDKKYLSK